MIIAGIDLGSSRIGIVAAEDVLPVRAVARDTILVNRSQLGITAADVVSRIYPGVGRVVLEHAPFFAPVGKSPAALAAMAQAHEIAAILHDLLVRELRSRGVRVDTIPRASWAHRVVPHTRGGITDEMANDGLRAHVTAEVWESMRGQDERDALGTLVGSLLPAPKKKYRSRAKTSRDEIRPILTPEQKAERHRIRDRERKRAVRGSLTPEQRAELGCACLRKHVAGCPLYECRASDRDARREEGVARERERIAAGVEALRAARAMEYH